MTSSTRFSRRTAIGAAATIGLAALATGLAVTPAMAASVPLTLSATSGPSGGTNTLTGTTTTAKFYSGAVVQFQYKATSTTACSAAYSTPVTVSSTAGIVNATPKILSSMKIAVTVPSTVALQGSATSANWLVCVFPGNNTTTSLLAANAAYTIAARPTIASSGAISPASGPALGGGSVTVTGTNFITGLTAKIGSQALTNVSVVSGTTFTATVPAQAAATGLTLSVTTTGGTATKTSAYSYTNGIVISPNTTPTSTVSTDIDVQGVGFSGMDFSTTDGSTPNNNNAHVYLVAGDYDPTDNSGAKTVTEDGECVNVLVVSDTELICTLNTTHAYNQSSDSAIADGVYTLTVVDDGGVDVQSGGANVNANYSQSIISSGSTFTVAPY
jgi:hypothetical protein